MNRLRAATPAWVRAVLASTMLLCPSVSAHEGHDHGPEPSVGRLSLRNADGSVTLATEAQAALGIEVMTLKDEDVTLTRELPGRVIAAPGGLARLQVSRDGRVGAQERFPFVGQRVEKDSLVLSLDPVFSAADENQLRQSLIGVDREIALLLPRAQHVGQVNPLMPMGDATVQILQELQIQSDSLARQRETVRELLTRAIEVRAPFAGTVSAVAVAAGQIVSARDTVIEIVADGPSRVEAWDLDPSARGDAMVLGGAGAADAGGGRSIAVTFAGRGPTLRQQASVLLFDTTAGAPPLAIGSSVRVSVPIAAAQRAIVVPASAVMRTGSGIGVIWEQAQPERFLPRLVTLAPAGPDRIVLTAGAQAGMVVVTSGAALIHHTP